MTRIHWGWRIAMLYGSFVVFILYMVYRSVQMKTDLVTPDYYAEELKYQEHIDKVKRTSELSSSLQWQKTDKNISYTFPAEFVGKKINADVYFYCPSNIKKDTKLNLETTSGQFTLDVTSLQKGFYQMKINWKADDISYYNEGNITVN